MLSKRLASLAMSVLVLFLSGCAHLGANSDSKPSEGGSSGPGENGVIADSQVTATDLNDTGADLKAVPLAVNRQVLKWIDYFQGQGRPHMERYLSRSTRYMPVMKKILKENGLPEDLIYIALIESGFSGTAHSSASAVGYWQFIKGTGKHYKLKIDSYTDERRDFIRSTEAAAAYFKDLYDLFNSWYLAIASYNVGEGRVKNLVKKYNTRDFWQLARENKLPLETSDYVPKFIAARLIAKEPDKYGFTDIDYMPALEYSTVNFSTSIDLHKLASQMGLEYDDLRDLNPSHKRGVAFEKAGQLVIRVPKGTEEKAVAAATSAAAESKKAYVSEEDYGYYKIRKGDTISTIARKFRTSQRNIRTLNNLSVGSSLVAGKRLRVPAENISEFAQSSKKGSKTKSVDSEVGEKTEAAKPSTQSDRGPGSAAPHMGVGAAQKYMGSNRDPQGLKSLKAARSRKIHIVRKGETLMGIARHYRVSLRTLTNQNKINRQAKLSIGARLEIP